jgi:hypothetical protein
MSRYLKDFERIYGFSKPPREVNPRPSQQIQNQAILPMQEYEQFVEQRLNPYTAIQEFEVYLKDKDEWYRSKDGFKINEKFIINNNNV